MAVTVERMTKNPTFLPNRGPRAVDIVTFPDVQLLDIAGPLQVFASVNRLFQDHSDIAPYAVRLLAHRADAVTTAEGLSLGVTVAESPECRPLDTLVIAGGPGAYQAATDDGLVTWVTQLAHQARRVASVCSGAFILAATGLLDGRRAVTHWSRSAELAQRHPKVHVESDPIFVCDDNIWTSAGVSTGIDLALALVEEDLGREVSLTIAQDLVVFLKRAGDQDQLSVSLSTQQRNCRFGALHSWIGQNLSKDLSVPVLAAQVRMSERSFMRHYLQETGLTPARAIERLRVQTARQLLIDSQLPVKQISRQCGLGSEENLRRSFVRVLGTTPKAYREKHSR